MDPFLIFLTVIITVLTVVLTVVGIQIILILRNINHTLGKANQTIDAAEAMIHSFKNPLSDLKALGDGVKTGLQIAQHIVTWIKQKNQTEN